MKTLSIATVGAALIALGTASQAQAALEGFWNLGGSANISADSIDWLNINSANSGDDVFAFGGTGDFGSAFGVGTIQDLDSLTNPVANFISVNNLSFNLTAFDSLVFDTTQNSWIGRFTGVFNDADSTVGQGYFTAQNFTPSSFSMTIEASAPEPQAVPEPTSLLGLLAVGALGTGLSFKKKQTL